jgi:hypothetical protein
LKRKNQVIEIRRKYVFEMASKGDSQVEIARKLQVHESTISNDLDYLREESTQNIRKYIDKILPLEYEKTLAGLTAILKEMWAASEKAGQQDTREKVLALSLAKEIYDMRINLLTNASTLDLAMKFISEYKEEGKHEHEFTDKKSVMQQQESTSNQITEQETTNNTTNQVF